MTQGIVYIWEDKLIFRKVTLTTSYTDIFLVWTVLMLLELELWFHQG